MISQEEKSVPIFKPVSDGPCKLRQNEYMSCSAVVAAERFERVKEGNN